MRLSRKAVAGAMRQGIRPEQVLAAGFILLILAGTVLLALPVATRSGHSIGVFNSLFTATSAVCVTGLVAVDTGTTFSGFGQGVLLVLIQMGGLGFMIFATMVMVALGRKITLRERMVIRESMNTATMSGLVQLTCAYTLLTLLIELAGALLLATRFVPRFGWGKGVWYSVFHAVSAFCNAGFDLFGDFSSLTGFCNDPVVLLTIAALIILGGLGFAVMFEVLRSGGHWKRLTLHAKLTLTATALLLAVGWLFYGLVEWNNPKTLAAEGVFGPFNKVMNAFFQSVTMRTAGFNSVPLADLKESSKLFSMVLMFIGASPASTGGGIKTTTVSVVLLITLSVVRGHQEVNVMGRRLPTELMRRALAILSIFIAMLFAGIIALTLAEGETKPAIDLMFEGASALATVGVSSVGTPGLSPVSKGILVPMMYFGRVGPLTLAMALAKKQGSAQNHIRYPEEHIMIG